MLGQGARGKLGAAIWKEEGDGDQTVPEFRNGTNTNNHAEGREHQTCVQKYNDLRENIVKSTIQRRIGSTTTERVNKQAEFRIRGPAHTEQQKHL